MKRAFVGAAILATIAAGGLAQSPRQPRPAEDESAALRSTKDVPPKVTQKAKTGGANARSYASADWEVWRNLTIGPGQSVTLHSDLDFSTADSARVSIRSRNNDLPGIVMDAYWAVPQAEFYSVAEVVDGSIFPYRNVGGVTFTTFGSQFRLRVTNNGSSNIFLSQVVIFARLL